MWHKMYTALRDAGIAVYSPGQKQGVCETPYVVLSDGVTSPRCGGHACIESITVMALVPDTAYSQLEEFIGRVRNALAGFRASGKRSAAVLLPDVRAYRVTLEYLIYKKC